MCPSPLLGLYVPVRPSWSAEFGLADGIPGVRHFYRVGQVSRLCVRTLRHPPYNASPFKFSHAPLLCSRTSHHRRSTSSMTSFKTLIHWIREPGTLCTPFFAVYHDCMAFTNKYVIRLDCQDLIM